MLSNVALSSGGTGMTTSVLVDGFPIKGVISVSASVEPNGLTVTTIDVIGARTADPAVFALDQSTPIYDDLLALHKQRDLFEEYASRGR